jgi:hypothetical protein
MKLLILIVTLATGYTFFLPKQKDIAGTWVLDTTGKKCEPAVLHIQMAEGYFTGKLDMPDQQLYDRPVTVQFNQDKIKILLDPKGSCFIEGTVTDSLILGRSVVCGKMEPVKFYRVKN